LSGVTVVLYATNTTTATVTAVATAVTSSTGSYEFTNLLPGIYEVGFTSPASGFTGSPQLVGSNTNINSAPSATTGLTQFFTMLSGQTNLSLNAGFVPSATPVTIVSLKASVTPGGVVVTWQTYDELDMLAFDVARSAAGGQAQDVTPDFVMAIGQDLGATYTVTDAGATAPGVYTYALYGIDDNLVVENKGTVTVQVTGPTVTVPTTLTISGLTITGGNAVLNWAGGQPPYLVEQSPSLGTGAVWQPVGPAQTGTQLILPLTNQTSFFRVSGGQ